MCQYCSLRTARQLSSGSGHEQAVSVHHKLLRHYSWTTIRSMACDSRLRRVNFPTSSQCQLTFVSIASFCSIAAWECALSEAVDKKRPLAQRQLCWSVQARRLSSNVTPSIVVLVQVGMPHPIVSDTQQACNCWQYCSSGSEAADKIDGTDCITSITQVSMHNNVWYVGWYLPNSKIYLYN